MSAYESALLCVMGMGRDGNALVSVIRVCSGIVWLPIRIIRRFSEYIFQFIVGKNGKFWTIGYPVTSDRDPPIQETPHTGTVKTWNGINRSIGAGLGPVSIGIGLGKSVSFNNTELSVERDGWHFIESALPGQGDWRPRYKSTFEWDGDVYPVVGHVQRFENEVTECHFH